MADPSIPRYEDYFDAQGRPRPATPRPKRTLRQQAGRLIRDLPAAADSLNAFPGGAVAAAPLKLGARGLQRIAPRVARMVDGPSPAPVMREPTSRYTRSVADEVLASAELNNYAFGVGAATAATKLGANLAGRNVRAYTDEERAARRSLKKDPR